MLSIRPVSQRAMDPWPTRTIFPKRMRGWLIDLKRSVPQCSARPLPLSLRGGVPLGLSIHGIMIIRRAARPAARRLPSRLASFRWRLVHKTPGPWYDPPRFAAFLGFNQSFAPFFRPGAFPSAALFYLVG